MDINFEYYKIFYYVAKYKNITKAAKVLNSNQPNVTRVIKILESQLNCRLFIRESRGLKLTGEGERLFSHIEMACQYLLTAEEKINCEENEYNGTVEIGVTETALHLFLLRKLHNFKKKYPEMKIKIQNSTTPEILKLINNGKLDFAVITTPYLLNTNFYFDKMMEFSEILVGGTDYIKKKNSKIKLEDIKKYSFVGLGNGTATYEFYKKLFVENKIDYELDMEVATSDLIIPLILNNLGIGFVAEEMAKLYIEEKKIVKMELDIKIPKREIQMVWDSGRGKSKSADILYNFLMMQ